MKIFCQTSGGALPAQSARKKENEDQKSHWRWSLNHLGCVTSSLLQCQTVTDQSVVPVRGAVSAAAFELRCGIHRSQVGNN